LQNSEGSALRWRDLPRFHPKEGACLPAHLGVQGIFDLIQYCVRLLAEVEGSPHLLDRSNKRIMCTPFRWAR
jgi:hypothetical protein